MKRISIFCLCLVLFVSVLVSCGDKTQVCSGNVKKLNDTLLVASVGGHNIRFDVSKAEYSNGFVMVGDSVIVHYVGDLREKKAKAAVVRLIPKKGVIVDAVYDESKELKVSEHPLSEKASEDLERLRRGNH